MDKMEAEKEVSWLGARLREPSTYVGAGAVLVGLLHLSAGAAATDASVLTYGGLFLGGVIGMFLPEAGASK